MRTEDNEVNKGVQVVRYPVFVSKLFLGVYFMGSNSELLFESPFPFFLCRSKLAFIGVIGVQNPPVRTFFPPMALGESSRNGEVPQESSTK